MNNCCVMMAYSGSYEVCSGAVRQVSSMTWRHLTEVQLAIFIVQYKDFDLTNMGCSFLPGS